MAVISAEERRRCGNQFLRDLVKKLQPANGEMTVRGLVKDDVRAAINATDDWIDLNAAAFNLALPQPFRGTANATVKTVLFCYVAMRRAGILEAEEDR